MSLVHTSLTHTFRNRILQSVDRIAFKRKVREVWEEITYQEYYEFVQEICFSLLESGIERGDRVALLSQSRTEWAFADMGILSCGAITVPIYQSNLASEVEYILKNSEAKAIFVENETQLEKVHSIQKNIPSLKTLVIFEYKNAQALGDAIPLEEFCQKGLKRKDPKVFDELLQKNKSEDPATIVYTSGTTGLPKGVVLTHGNFISELSDIEASFRLSQEDTILSFLPFAHILARVELYCGLTFGWAHAFSEGIPQLVDNLAEIRPTFMFAVPRIYEKVYNKIISQVQDGSPLKKKIFYWSLSVGQEVSQRIQKGLPLSLGLKLKYAIASKLVFSKLKQKFGGRLRFFISGGAPLSKDIAEFFHAAGFLILEGYGLTETTAAAFVNQEYRYEFGTVGPPLGEVQVRIAPDGEILIKSKKVFKEYYKNPEATAEVLKDGWLYTGDIGHVTEKGNLKITDRKKDIIVTSAGKNVAPQKIENLLKIHRYISQAMVYGDKKNYLTALITLNLEEVTKFVKHHHIEETQIYSHPKIEKLISDLIAQTNKSLSSFETIKKFRILKNDFSIETGELTPSLKVKRKYCSEKYKEVIQSMY